jgi:hypothetical protein
MSIPPSPARPARTRPKEVTSRALRDVRVRRSNGREYVPEEDNVDEWVGEMDQRRVRILGHRLKGVEHARAVRRRNGKVLVTDGPFAETKEWIAGFDILECATLDEAVEIAARHPMARFGRLELRPFWPEE